jgi:hypothetical protein
MPAPRGGARNQAGADAMSKPLAGVIKQWAVIDNHVFGECEMHVDDPRPGGSIRTSRIVSIQPIKDSTAHKLETENSIYILI